jgi:hypothetical protein
MKERWDWLNAFWREKKRGPFKGDFIDFCIDFGLSDRTARESYWDRAEIKGIIRIVYEKKMKFWEYCDSPGQEEETEEEEPKVSAKTPAWERVEIRSKMEFGPCRGSCTKPLNEDCRDCITFRSLKNKNFLQEEGE